MTNEDYVRQSANKYGWKKYYSTLRPVSMGTQPKDGFMDFVNYDDRDVSDEVNAKLKEMYDKCRCTEDILIDVIRILYPEDTFKTGTIRGYNQRDWQDYIVKGDVDTDLLEAMYFGKISDITVTTDEEEFGDVITHDELWRAEREDGLKEFFRNHYELDKDEEIHILQADGYKQVVDWKAVG